MADFSASLVTPERVVFESEVTAVDVRTEVGEAAFLPGHTDLVGALVPGLVRFVREDGSEERAAVHGGFVQVDAAHVVVLAPVAELAGDIDVDRARRALERVSHELASAGAPVASPTTPDDPETARQIAAVRELEEAKRRAEVRLEVAGG